MKVHIDSTACSGHGMCYVTAPGIFSDDEQGYGQVIGDGAVPLEQNDEAENSVASCPERAISLS